MGLCGSGAPRGMVLRFVLEYIGTYYYAGDRLLDLVMKLRGELGGDDAGFDGNLMMELQTIIKWKRGTQFTAVELKLDDNTWDPAKEATTFLGVWGSRLCGPTTTARVAWRAKAGPK
eukprot:scaffold79290_cov41-Attheya_sp.AAC.2